MSKFPPTSAGEDGRAAQGHYHLTVRQMSGASRRGPELHGTAAVPRPSLPSTGTGEGFEAHRTWEQMLSKVGYGAIHWPTEYGGRGADVIMQAIFEEEYLLANGPERITVVGQKLMGPTLMAHGTDEQRRRWLPGIVSAEVIWSQGFSEPDAGSDLAGLKTKAVADGESLVVNGQKIWTSYGVFADWMFALVRTDPEAERHAGITFLAIDMTSDGIEARPITQLDGHAGFAEVFFTPRSARPLPGRPLATSASCTSWPGSLGPGAWPRAP